MAATTRLQRDGTRILDPAVARHGLLLWDAHMWACAEVHELGILYSEDFQHERWYGGVLVLDPFREG